MARVGLTQGRRVAAMGMALVAALAATAYAELPGDCIALARLESVDALVKASADFLAEVQPGTNPQMVPMLLGQKVRNPMLAGVDRSRPWWVVVLNPMQYGPKPSFVVPLTAYGQFEGALSTAMTKGQTVDGVTVFSTPAGQSVMIGLCTDHAVVTESKAACQAVMGLWNAGQIKPELLPLKPPAAAVAVTADMGKIWGLYQPIVMAMVQQFKALTGQRMQQQMPNPPPGADPAKVMAILEAEIDALVAVAEQLDQASLAVTLDKQAVCVQTDWRFKENTPLAKFLSVQDPKALALLKFMPADVVAAGSTRLVWTDEAMDWYMAFIQRIAGQGQEEALATLKAQVKAWMASWGGEFAMALLVPSGEGPCMEAVYLADLKDPKLAEKAIREMMNSMAAMKAFGAGLGPNTEIKCEENVGAYKGLSIHRQTTTFDLEALPAQQAEALRKLFGKAIVAEMVIVKDKLVFALGPTARKRLEQMVDSVLGEKGALLDSAAFTETFGAMPKDQSFVGFISLADMFEWVKRIAPIPVAIGYDSSAGIGVTARMAGRRVSTRVIVPVSEILAVKAAVTAAKQGAAAQP